MLLINKKEREAETSERSDDGDKGRDGCKGCNRRRCIQFISVIARLHMFSVTQA